MWAHLCRLPPCLKFPRSSRHSLSRPTPSSCPLLLPLPHSRSSGHSSPAAAHLKGRPTQRVPYGGRPTSPGRTPPQSLCTEHDRQGGGVGSRQSRAPAPRSVLRALAAARCPRLRCPALPFHSGSYGADITPEKLKDFHRRRLQVLASAVPDLIAFEAIPNKMEAQALVELLEEEKVQVPSWICFSSVDGKSLCSGESFADCLKILNASEKVAVVGVNCTPPQFIEGIICEFRKQTKKAIAVYPNSGEVWDGRAKRWLPVECLGHKSFDALAKRWQEAGASLIGGCCRTTPSTIRAVSKILKGRTGH